MADEDVIDRVYREVSTLYHTSASGKRLPTTEFKVQIPSKLKPIVDEGLKAVILGRSHSIHKKYGNVGLMDLGTVCEHQIEGNDLYGYRVLFDMLYPHVVFICGKRGSGKSYTLGIIAEELQRSGLGIGTVIIDPIGIFWSMKNKNTNKGECEVLKNWGLEPRGFEDVRVLLPVGYYEDGSSIADGSFSIAVSDLTVDDWCMVFDIDRFKTQGLLIGDAIERVRKGYIANLDGERIRVPAKPHNYSIGDLIQCIEYEVHINSRDEGYAVSTKRSIIARLQAATRWGIFSIEGTPITEISRPNKITVLDVSHPKLGEEKRALIAGIIARKIFEARMATSRREEVDPGSVVYGQEGAIPITWLIIDEAHLLLPHSGKTPASEQLIEYAKLGRKPGCALVLATQRPAATNDDIISQSDVLIGHNLALEDDMVALRRRVPAKLPAMMADSDFIRALPVGVAIIADQKTQQRTLVVQMRPRLSAHAGKSAIPRGKGKIKVSYTKEDKRDIKTSEVSGGSDVIAPTFSIDRYINVFESEEESVVKDDASSVVSAAAERIHDDVSEDIIPLTQEGGFSVAIKSNDPKTLARVCVQGHLNGKEVMLISRIPPKRILSMLPTKLRNIYWLTNKPTGTGDHGELPSSNLGKIAHTVEEFMAANSGRAMVVIEGIDYLVSNNDFQKVMRFIEALRETAVKTSSVFVYQFNPKVFDNMQVSKLESEGDYLRDFMSTPLTGPSAHHEDMGDKVVVEKGDARAVDAATVSELKALLDEIKNLEVKRRGLETERERILDQGKDDLKSEIMALIEEERKYILKEIRKIEEALKQQRNIGIETLAHEDLTSLQHELMAKGKSIDALEAEIISEPSQYRKTVKDTKVPVNKRTRSLPPPPTSPKISKEKSVGTKTVVDIIDVIPQDSDTAASPTGTSEEPSNIPWPPTSPTPISAKDEANMVNAVKPMIDETFALNIASKGLKKKYFGFGKRIEGIEDMELVAYPLLRVHIKSKRGLLKKDYIFTMIFDPVTGESLISWRNGLRRSKGLKYLFGLNANQVAVMLALNDSHGLTADEIAKRTRIPVSSVKRTLSALVKKTLVQESWDKDSGLKMYRRKFDLKYHKSPRDIEDFPATSKSYINRGFILPMYKPKDISKLFTYLYPEAMVVGFDVMYYPYFLATVSGRGGRRFIFVDAVAGEIDEYLSANIVNIEMAETPPKFK